MFRRLLMVAMSLVLVQAACGTSSTPSLDILPADGVQPQDQGQGDTSAPGDVDDTDGVQPDAAQPDGVQPDVIPADDSVPIDSVQPDTTPIDPGVEDPGVPDVTPDTGLDTTPPADPGADTPQPLDPGSDSVEPVDPGTGTDFMPDDWVDVTNPPDVGPDEQVPPDVGPDQQVPPDVGPDQQVPPDVGPDEQVPPDVGPDEQVPVDVGPEADTPIDGNEVGEVDAAEVIPECLEDLDCEEKGDPSMCHRFACVEGACVEVAVDDGMPCTDGEFCTAPDSCRGGQCEAGPAVTCDDGDLCTVDSCTPGACLNIADTTVLTCGTGECLRQVPRCSDGVIHTCEPGPSAPETCDGLDNNCDGQIDEFNPGGGNDCVSDLQGPCTAGTSACSNGIVVCIPDTPPVPETCDGIDNDCDGLVDQGDPNGGLRCLTTKLGVCSIGATGCINGLLVCNETVQPSLELCDGLDNDCDGQVDEENPGSGLSCSTGKPGVCGEGISACVDGKIACLQVGQPSAEVCDGVDNDCDGIADPAGATGCLPFLRDTDGDGYGVSGDVQCLCAATAPYTGTVEGDCCDIDDRARPSVTTPFPELNKCGSFDYNCDGQLTLQYDYPTGSCGFWPVCRTTPGWQGATPTCGGAGEILTDCNLDVLTCAMVTSKVTQGCF